jgi:hypothetical protein
MPVLEAQEAKGAAQALGLEAARLEIWGSEDVAPAFEAMNQSPKQLKPKPSRRAKRMPGERARFAKPPCGWSLSTTTNSVR